MVGPVVDRLRADDHSVIFVAEMWPGIGDTEVLAVSRSAEALPITADKDFGELVFRQGLRHSGVLLIRLDGLGFSEKAKIVSTAVRLHGADFEGRFSVLTRNSLRTRR